MPNWLISFDLGKGCLEQGNPFSFGTGLIMAWCGFRAKPNRFIPTCGI
jgi:hypothetical protein